MFEVGFSEIAIIAVMALIVLGPERLPRAARMVGTFMRKARRSFESLKYEVERELEAEELKKQFAQIAAAPAAFANELQQPFEEAKAALEHNVDAVVQSAKQAWQDAPSSNIDLEKPLRGETVETAIANESSQINENAVHPDVPPTGP
jgi:sec-independent protein translocase protein TatB